MLLGLVFATSGEIEVMGSRIPKHANRVLRDVGALVEGPAAYPNLSGRANLKLLDAAGPRGDRRTRRHRIDDALEQVGMAGIDRRPVKTYSLGMRQRLGLAAALVRRPRLLILDEPGNGLDPHGIRDTRQLLLDLNQGGVTIFLSSHLLAEVEQLCTRVGILDRGRLVLQEQLETLRAPTGRVLLDTPDVGQVAALLDGEVEQRDGSHLVIRHPDAAVLNERLVREGIRVSSIGPSIPARSHARSRGHARRAAASQAIAPATVHPCELRLALSRKHPETLTNRCVLVIRLSSRGSRPSSRYGTRNPQPSQRVVPAVARRVRRRS